MLGRILVVWVAGLVPGGTGPDSDLAKLARHVGANSYTFTVTHEMGNAARSVEGKYQAGAPVYFLAKDIEFFRAGAVLVYKDDGRWQRSRTGTASDPLRILGAAARVRAVARLPHEELAGLPLDLVEVKRTEGKAEKGPVVFSGILKQEALKKWTPTEWQSVAVDGSVAVVATGNVVQRYTVVLRLRGKLGNADVNGKYLRTVTLSDVGTTRVEVPAAAAAALK
jgi:hypothetical protein